MKEKMETIKTKAEVLARKTSWIRKETDELMETWAEISACGEEISCTTPIYTNDCNINFYLISGEKELKNVNKQDIDKNSLWSNVIEASDLRAILYNLPDYVEEILQLIDKKIGLSEDAITFLIKMK